MKRKMLIVLAISLFTVNTVHAGYVVSGRVQGEVWDVTATVEMEFEGLIAKAIYEKLDVAEDDGPGFIKQKVGKNISCYAKENKYRCAMAVDSKGAGEPSPVVRWVDWDNWN